MAFSSTLRLIGPFVKMEGNLFTVTVTFTSPGRYLSFSSKITVTFAVPPITPVITPVLSLTVTMSGFVLK